MNPSNKHTWCINAFHSLSASTIGETRPCCMYRPTTKTNLQLGKDKISDHFNNKEIINLRKDLTNGIRHIGCTRCWQEEDAGRESKRIRDNKNYTGIEQGLLYLDMALGNQCNIKCRTCGPHSSSQWLKEAYETKYNKFVTLEVYNQEVKKYSTSYEDDSNLWSDLENYLDNIKILEFYGGEPLLNKKMWKILELCVEKDIAKKIELRYATNGTLWPDQVELWKHFKHVDLSFSIDGLENKFEYLRHMAKWKDFTRNFITATNFSSNVKIHWCVTISNLNIYYLGDIIKEYYEKYAKKGVGLYLNLLHAPLHFNVGIMPENIKKEISSILNQIPKEYSHAWRQLPGIIEFMNNGCTTLSEWDNFFTEIKTTDQYRNQDYSQVFPEFAKLIGLIK